MTPLEASKIIGCSLSHVGWLLRNGKLKFKKHGRYYIVNGNSAHSYARTHQAGFPRGSKRSKERGVIKP